MQKKIVSIFVAVFAAAVFSAGPAHADKSSRVMEIAAVVNESAISESDVTDRMRLIMVSSGMPDTPDMRSRVRPQVVNMLVDENIMMQQAAKLEIDVSSADVDAGVARIAEQNNIPPDQFRALLRREGVSVKALEGQIRAQVAWSRVIQKKIRPNIMITDRDIDAVLARLQASRGRGEYLVSEIFLPVDTPANEPQVQQLAQRLTAQLTQRRAPFQAVAGQFSQAASAARGGDLGWVQQGQLPEEIEDMLGRMRDGELSQPVRSTTGYHILYLRQKRVISDETMPLRGDIENKLGMEQLDRAQRGLLMDLRAAAFIEHRV